MELTDNLLECLKAIDYSIFNEEYVDNILNNRDNDPFDSEWCRVCEEIESLKTKANYTNDNKDEFLRISQQSFMIVDSYASCELSTYVADDFGMIYDSLVLGYKDEWLDKLIKCYSERRIPNGEL